MASADAQRFPVAISRRPYPIPSRTRKSSFSEPMVLHGLLCGRVGRCRANLTKASTFTSRPLVYLVPARVLQRRGPFRPVGQQSGILSRLVSTNWYCSDLSRSWNDSRAAIGQSTGGVDSDFWSFRIGRGRLSLYDESCDSRAVGSGCWPCSYLDALPVSRHFRFWFGVGLVERQNRGDGRFRSIASDPAGKGSG